MAHCMWPAHYNNEGNHDPKVLACDCDYGIGVSNILQWKDCNTASDSKTDTSTEDWRKESTSTENGGNNQDDYFSNQMCIL